MDRMVCALLDRYHLLGALAVDLRFGVGAIAVFAPGAVHWDRHGSRAIAHLATGDGSRARILEDANACLRLHKEPGHAPSSASGGRARSGVHENPANRPRGGS